MLLKIKLRQLSLRSKIVFDEDYWSGCVSHFWRKHKESKLRIRKFAIQNPTIALKAFFGHLFIPRLTAELGQTRIGLTIKDVINRKILFGTVSLGFFGACVLHIPVNAADYSAGSSKQTLRRKVRAARKVGVTWRSVTDLVEQRALINTLHAYVPAKTRIRLEGNDWGGLVGSKSWTVGYGPDGQPLIIAVTPHDGQWAIIDLFVTLGETQIHSDARYYLTQVVVEKLSASGVKYLLDTDSANNLPAGLWHFQRMIGFKVARVRVARSATKVDLQGSASKTYAYGPSTRHAVQSDVEMARTS
ncbi:hypothetical protein MKL09_06360 [Methylobacterium sp. J-048]|uniref:hypothetical protein n=1 Tax=Methylobacterium sp. J-048 TaxID=2836635 RepID=UPI001FB96B6F|nr:hypothetical protein [Methylobacterium sp. J-048]MCJ2056168.1 hypothetical protein [Methylobacterium sp. J-048]